MSNIEGKIYKEIVKDYSMGGEDAIFTITNALDKIKANALTEDNAKEVYFLILEKDCGIQDDKENFREGDEKTDIEPEYSRNYEGRSVASRMGDGTWIGWTYWYGGGKYGNPEEIEWIEDAYELSMVEEEVKIIKRTFAKI